GRRSPDQWIAGEHVDGLEDLADTRGDRRGVVLRQMFDDAVEIIEYPRRQFDAGHSRARLAGRRVRRLLAGNALLEISPRIGPGDRFSRCQNIGEARLGQLLERAAPLARLGLLRDRIDDEAMRG